MGFWDDLAGFFKKGVSVVAQKTDEYTKIGKIKVDVIGIKREIDKQHTAIGKKVYQLIAEEKNTKIATNEEIKEAIDKVKELNVKLSQKKEELEAVRNEYAEKTGKPMEEPEVVAPEEEAKG